VGKDNVVRTRQISILAELPHVYAVSEGLSTGDKIIVEGIRKVKPNEKIQYTSVDPLTSIKSLELEAE
jgi:membrane fusion protein (multidrug efflux system)